MSRNTFRYLITIKLVREQARGKYGEVAVEGNEFITVTMDS